MRLIFNIILAISFVFAQDAADIKKKIIESGLSESQIRQMAKQWGMSDAQVDAKAKELGLGDKAAEGQASQPTIEDIPEIRTEDVSIELPEAVSEEVIQLEEQSLDIIGEKTIETIIDDRAKQTVIDTKNENIINIEKLDIIDQDELEIVDDNLILESQTQTGRQALSYFGYEIFQRDPAVFQSSVFGAVDPNYNIGPNDEIIIMLWGETQFRQVLTVDREGFIFIPEVGQVFVNGLTMDLLESKLFKVLSQRYSSLIRSNSGSASTFLDISLGNLRPLRVIVLGEVGQPGAYQVSPSTTLFHALYYFNGPTTLGSLRDIRLIRSGKQIASIDFYDYLLSGKKIDDIRLQLDDTIFLPKRGKTVSIQGEINRQAIYELKKGEGLKDLIEIAGGLRVSAYMNRAQIDRIVPPGDRDALGMDRMFIDVDLGQILESKKGFALTDGDKIQIFSILDMRQNTVEINGAIVRPGRYDINEAMFLKDLILRADSLVGDAYLDRVDLVRINSDFTEKILKLNLKLALEGHPDHNIELKSLDRVTVYGKSTMIPRRYVTISGHVKIPGRYLLREDLTLYDLIFKAGGFTDKEYLKTTYRQRAELVRVSADSVTKEIIPFDLSLVLDKKGIADELLKSNDAVRIYSLSEITGFGTKYVSISGHVKRPGQYEIYEENMTLYDLIFKAGGFTDKEYLKTTYRQRAELVRVSADSVTKKIIPFNLDLVLAKKGIANEQLKSNDAVHIYSVVEIRGTTKYASISGHVKRPGQYEIYEENMTLYDLIFKTGGFNDEEWKNQTFLGRADLIRFDEDRITRSIIPFNLGEVLENAESTHNLQLQPGDEIRIYAQTVFNAEKPVSITGVVKNPGQYTLKTVMTLKDFILEAGGLSESVYKYKIEVARIDPNKVSEDIFAETITLDMDEKFSISNVEYTRSSNPGEISVSRNGFKLQPYDHISIRPDPYFSLQRFVTLNGAVYYPGDYTILTPNETISSIIKRAGGLRPNAYADASLLVREGENINLSITKAINKPGSKHDYKVLARDIITINVYPNVVAVLGEVNNPGLFGYTSGLSTRDYIRLAGGFTSKANKSDVWIRYASGEAKEYNRFSLFSPRVKDGAVITVARDEREEIDRTELAKEVTSIMASLAQVIAIVLLASR